VLNNRTQSIITKRLLRDNSSALRAATQRNNKVNLRQNRSKVNRCNEMEYKIAETAKNNDYDFSFNIKGIAKSYN